MFFFFRYKAYRDEQAKLHDAWLEREQARQAAIARGDPNPPPAEPDPTAEREIGCWGLIKFFSVVVLVVVLAGKFVTGEWGMAGSELGLDLDLGGAVKRWLLPAVPQRLFSEQGLGEFTGADAGKLIYLAVEFFFLGPPPPCLSGWLLFTDLVELFFIFSRLTERFTTFRVIAAYTVRAGPMHSCMWRSISFSLSLSLSFSSPLGSVASVVRASRTAYTNTCARRAC